MAVCSGRRIHSAGNENGKASSLLYSTFLPYKYEIASAVIYYENIRMRQQPQNGEKNAPVKISRT